MWRWIAVTVLLLGPSRAAQAQTAACTCPNDVPVASCRESLDLPPAPGCPKWAFDALAAPIHIVIDDQWRLRLKDGAPLAGDLRLLVRGTGGEQTILHTCPGGGTACHVLPLNVQDKSGTPAALLTNVGVIAIYSSGAQRHPVKFSLATPAPVPPIAPVTPRTTEAFEACARLERGKNPDVEAVERPFAFADYELICIDAVNGGPARFLARGAGVVAVNRPLLIVAQAAEDFKIQVSGASGLVPPGNAAAAHAGGVFNRTAVFPARKESGNITLKTIVGDRLLASAEFIVEKEYAAALRVGIAGVWLPGRPDETFVASQRAGSNGQLEVVSDSTSALSGEVVVGFVPFWLERLVCGRYRPEVDRGCWAHRFAAPYVGLGVVAASAKGIDPMTSLYIAAEFELTPTFSLSGGYVLRRVERLRDGLRIGSAVSTDTDLTERQLAHGIGLVFNVGPEFLKLVAGGGK